MVGSPLNSRKGFTLIEILVVIAIIGILSSLVLASLSVARQKSRDAKRIADLDAVKKALILYFDANQTYPSTTPAGYSGDDAGIREVFSAGFIGQIPTPPPGGSVTYIYRGVDASGLECVDPGVQCASFQLGVTLERADSAVLASDADRSVGTFYGASQDCLTLPSATERCYDTKF